jgi:hypothetical protein
VDLYFGTGLIKRRNNASDLFDRSFAGAVVKALDAAHKCSSKKLLFGARFKKKIPAAAAVVTRISLFSRDYRHDPFVAPSLLQCIQYETAASGVWLK